VSDQDPFLGVIDFFSLGVIDFFRACGRCLVALIPLIWLTKKSRPGH
jgi:hypothetical protein